MSEVSKQPDIGRLAVDQPAGAREDLLGQIAVAPVHVGRSFYEVRTPGAEKADSTLHFDINVTFPGLTHNPGILSSEVIVRAALDRLQNHLDTLLQQPNVAPPGGEGFNG
jgi:hypothetical protein